MSATALFLAGFIALLLWLAALVAITLIARPRAVLAGPASDELGSERPAVVNFLVNRWSCTPDAVRATIVDLIARGYLRLRAPAPGQPAAATVRPDSPVRVALTRYERRVLRRLRQLMREGVAEPGGMVPLSALAFRRQGAARRWLTRFAEEVAAEARAKRLARIGVSTSLLSLATTIPAALLALGVLFTDGLRRFTIFEQVLAFLAIFLGVIAGLILLTEPARHPRDTRAGRLIATHWLGVRQYFTQRRTDLCQADVADVLRLGRELAYATALGVTPAIQEAIDIVPGRPRQIRSDYGGTSRTVLVRPPRLPWIWGWGAVGCAATGLAAAGIAVLDGWLLLRYGGQLPDSMAFGAGVGLTGLIGCALALVTLAVVDVVLTVERTGVVLFVETAPGVWAHRRPHMAPQTTRHYRIAVDDGHSGEVTPWALPAALWNGTCSGDVVQVRVRRLTGLVVRLTPVSTAD